VLPAIADACSAVLTGDGERSADKPRPARSDVETSWTTGKGHECWQKMPGQREKVHERRGKTSSDENRSPGDGKRFPDNGDGFWDNKKRSSGNGERSADDFLAEFGRSFVSYTSRLGYAPVMRATGRHFRDFLSGIDNLHESMRFSYPRMASPSFYVSAEDQHGCFLRYR